MAMHSPDKRQQIYERDGYRCVNCGSQDRLTLDHIKPVSKGGTGDPDNLQTLCYSCNPRPANTGMDTRRPCPKLKKVSERDRERERERNMPPPSTKKWWFWNEGRGYRWSASEERWVKDW